eukprot:SAG22_NODE_6700_length_821_cov_37.031856_2_plen_74_part_00
MMSPESYGSTPGLVRAASTAGCAQRADPLTRPGRQLCSHHGRGGRVRAAERRPGGEGLLTRPPGGAALPGGGG